MKNIIAGLVLGAIAVWFFYSSPKGKLIRTETRTNEVSVTVIETQIVQKAEYQYVWKTNEVFVTNIIEQVVKADPVTAPWPVTAETIPPAQVTRPAVQPATPAPTVKTSTGLKGSRAAGGVNVPGRPRGTTKMGVKRNLDGSIKQ
jgi:hypothetical protein